MMVPVFVSVIEVRPLEGCELDPVEFNGACVRVYIAAANESEARSTLDDALREHHFELMGMDFIVQENLVEWENPHDALANESIAGARESKGMVFSDFRAWGHDDPDADQGIASS